MRFAIIATVLLVFAVGSGFALAPTPHSLVGFLENSDSSIPLVECLRFCAYFGGDSLCFPDDSGAGGGTRYQQSTGFWLVETSNFSPAPVDGDTVYVRFWNSCNGEGALIVIEMDFSQPIQEEPLVTLAEMGITGKGNLPEKALLSVYPNPFNASCRIEANSDIKVYDLSGRLLKSFDIGSDYVESVIWDGSDQTGKILPAGVYFVTTANARRVVKVMLVK